MVHFWGHSVDGTRRVAVDGYASDWCVLWPFDLISMCHVQVHTWPNFGKNIYEHIVFTRFFGLLPAVTFIFDLWSQKLISTSTNPNTSKTKIGKIPFLGLWDTAFTKFSGHCLVWPWRLTFWPNEYVPGHHLILVKSAEIITKILYSLGFRVIASCDLDLWSFNPKS